jgi:cytoskeletal protein CcmA (bactofilin family)
MWNKREDEPLRPSAAAPTPMAAAPVAPQPPAYAATSERREPAGIGPSITIVGDVSGDEDLTILGKVEGKIVLPKHSVTIGHGGRVKADIHAKFVSVAGEVHGNLVAGEQIVIRKTATMLGNLTAPRVGLEDGCRFRGSVEMEAPRQAASSSSSSSSASSSSSSPSTKSEPAKSESTSNKPEPAPLRT